MLVIQALVVGKKYNVEKLIENSLKSEYDEVWTLAGVFKDLPRELKSITSVIMAMHEGEEDLIKETIKAESLLNKPTIVTPKYFESIVKDAIGLPPRMAINSSLAGLLYYVLMEILPFDNYQITFEGFPMLAEEEYFHQRESVAYYIGQLESYAVVENYYLLHEGEIYGSEGDMYNSSKQLELFTEET